MYTIVYKIHVVLLTGVYLYKVLSCSTTFFQLSPFCATFFQLPMFMLFIPSKTSCCVIDWRILFQCNLYKVLSCSTTFFQLSPFCATFFQLPMFMLFIPSKTSSSQRVLGLPIGLLDMGFHLLIFCTILSSAMRSTWPNQFNVCFLINPIIFCTQFHPTSWCQFQLQMQRKLLPWSK